VFGKGVYFADSKFSKGPFPFTTCHCFKKLFIDPRKKKKSPVVTKSANYCRTNRAKNTALLVLCEVVLDKPFETLSSDSTLPRKLPADCGSTWGKGMTMPDPKQHVQLGDITVPLGKPILDTGVRNGSGFTLQYNELVVLFGLLPTMPPFFSFIVRYRPHPLRRFIVYDTSRIRFKYLVKVKFNYK
jgi:hypothetical protein